LKAGILKVSDTKISPFAALYFAIVMGTVSFSLVLWPFRFIFDVHKVLTTHQSVHNTIIHVGGIGLAIGASIAFESLRKMYLRIPWFYPFIIIFFLNAIIMSVALLILNMGYASYAPYSEVFIIIAVVELILFRLTMCWHIHSRPPIASIN
jgi:hypothetical protein